METKPGYKTTEFWLTIAVVAADLITALLGILPPQFAGMASAIATGLYALGRGQAKSGIKPDTE